MSWFGADATFHHVGLAVESIAAVRPGAEPIVEPTQRVALAFAEVHGIRVELLEPHGPGSPIARSLGEGTRLLHLCFEVDDLEKALAQCRPLGFHRLGPPVPTAAFPGRRIVWVFSKQLGLFELLERLVSDPNPPPSGGGFGSDTK